MKGGRMNEMDACATLGAVEEDVSVSIFSILL